VQKLLDEPKKREWVEEEDFNVDPDDEIIMETTFFKFKPGIQKDFV